MNDVCKPMEVERRPQRNSLMRHEHSDSTVIQPSQFSSESQCLSRKKLEGPFEIVASKSIDVNKNRSFGKRDVGNSRVVPDVRALMLRKTIWREKCCNLGIVLDVSEGIRTDKFLKTIFSIFYS